MDTQVLIAGAGPVGLMLASELRLLDVDVVVVERLAEPTPFSKAFGLHARTVETMELRGLVEPLQAVADRGARMLGNQPVPTGTAQLAHFAGMRTVRLDALDTDHPGLLPIAQTGTEAVLAARAAELGVDVRRGHTLTALDQDSGGITATIDAGQGTDTVRAEYLVGCDGGRSAVRKLTGFAFPGSDPTITGRVVEVAVPELLADPGMGWHRTAGGIISVLPGRILTVEFDGPPTERDTPVTVEEAAASMTRVAGRPIDIPAEPTWLTRFSDNTRLVDTYRAGRVLLAGDAAHVHSPFGGQGLNLGLQDAVNLGWKLAAHVRGRAAAGLLDSYGAERRPVAARVLHNTRAQVALMNPDPRTTPLREFVAELMGLDEVNRHIGAMLSALDVHYDLGGGHRLTGRFLPPLTLRTAAGPVAARSLLQSGRPLLIDLGAGLDVRPVDVDVVAAAVEGDPPAAALLVRPDGYVAWAGEDGTGVDAALSRLLTPVENELTVINRAC